MTLTGRLDAEAANRLRAQCASLREQGYERLALDLAAVSFVASSGVGTLLALTEEFKEFKGSLRLAALSEAVISVVSLLNLTQFLVIDRSLEESCAAVEV
jgi:anti-sigma B factor antagonist